MRSERGRRSNGSFAEHDELEWHFFLGVRAVCQYSHAAGAPCSMDIILDQEPLSHCACSWS